MTLSSEVFIRATETDPSVQSDATVQARAVIRTGQQRLLAALRPKVAMLSELELGVADREAVLTALTDFCTGPVRLHLAAADQALYTPVARAAETRLLIEAMRTTMTALHRAIDALARTAEADRAESVAQGIEALLAGHLAVEQAVLLPALADLLGIELTTMAADFTTILEGGRPPTG
jgi:hypothetical protein